MSSRVVAIAVLVVLVAVIFQASHMLPTDAPLIAR